MFRNLQPEFIRVTALDACQWRLQCTLQVDQNESGYLYSCN